MDVQDQLNAKGIRLRRYSFGNHYTTCPMCSAGRKNKKAPCLSVKIDESGWVAHCNHCPYVDYNNGAQRKSHQVPGREKPRPGTCSYYGALQRSAQQRWCGRKR